MPLPQIHLVGGTHREAVGLTPVATAMRAAGLLDPVLVAAGSDPASVGRALAPYALAPETILSATVDTRDPVQALAAAVHQIDELFARRTPAVVVVHGDTVISLACALAAHWRRIPVVQLAAGLRPAGLGAGPDEANRRLLTQVVTAHLAPTALAAMNLLDEGIDTGDIMVTGSTAVDAILALAAHRPPVRDTGPGTPRRLVLVTVHRRRSPEAPLGHILAAVRTLVSRHSDVDVVLPCPDPATRAQAETVLGGLERVTLTGPLAYLDLPQLFGTAYLVLTESGAVQQLAPSFGVPVLVPQDTTEQVEAVDAGCVRLVGSNPDAILAEVGALLGDRSRRDAMTEGGNPYGDGRAGQRAAQATAALLGLADLPEEMPSAPSTATAA